jgi:hypothetical protein
LLLQFKTTYTNLSLAEINNLLKKYGHGEVSISDTPYFLAGSESQTVTGMRSSTKR